MTKSVQVFGRLKDEHGHVIFTCSTIAITKKIASVECLRKAKEFLGTKPKTSSGCGCAKPSYKMSLSRHVK
jgi:hypothetical protein